MLHYNVGMAYKSKWMQNKTLNSNKTNQLNRIPNKNWIVVFTFGVRRFVSIKIRTNNKNCDKNSNPNKINIKGFSFWDSVITIQNWNAPYLKWFHVNTEQLIRFWFCACCNLRQCFLFTFMHRMSWLNRREWLRHKNYFNKIMNIPSAFYIWLRDFNPNDGAST